MARGHHIRQEDKQALVDLVREEIEAHQRREVERLTTNLELTDLLGVCRNKISLYLLQMPKELISYRTHKIEVFEKTKITPEDKEALLELVKEEICLYEQEKLHRLSTNDELRELLGVSRGSLIHYLMELPETLRKHRSHLIHYLNGKVHGKENGEKSLKLGGGDSCID